MLDGHLPCSLCGGDGYSPFNILKMCPDCDGLGLIYIRDPYPLDNEKIDEISGKDSNLIDDDNDDYDPIPF